MRTHVEFRSTKFPPYEGEEEEVVDIRSHGGHLVRVHLLAGLRVQHGQHPLIRSREDIEEQA